WPADCFGRAGGMEGRRMDTGIAAMKQRLTHYDTGGSVRMVDVTEKPATHRTARAHAFVRLRSEVLQKLPENPKGNPLEIARIAGIAGAKRTAELIPLCHPLMLTHVDVETAQHDGGIEIVSTATTSGPTGVEMEALTAAAVAALTIYDMTKGLDKSIEISEVYLSEKTGGKSGEYRRKKVASEVAQALSLPGRDSSRTTAGERRRPNESGRGTLKRAPRATAGPS